MIMLYGSAMVWPSRQQKPAALSTAEADYCSLGDLGRGIVWVRQLMSDLGSPTLSPTPACEDSRSAIKWATESASWAKTRHIAAQAVASTQDSRVGSPRTCVSRAFCSAELIIINTETEK